MTILREGVLLSELVILILYAIIMIFKKVKFSKILFNLAFGAYIAVIIAICFFPIRLNGEYGLTNNFIPFKGIIESIKVIVTNHSRSELISVLGNFVLLMPLGFFLNFYVKDMKNRLIDICLFSLAIELIQFIIGLIIGYNYRCVDIDDFILNSLGGIIVCLITSAVIDKYISLKKSKEM